MTVVKRYNPSTSQWEKVIVGREANWDTPQPLTPVTAAYTVAPEDAGAALLVDSATPVTITVDAATGFTVGQRVEVVQVGAGEVDVDPDGVTVNATPGLVLRAQWSAATLLCVATDVYVLLGDVKP